MAGVNFTIKDEDVERLQKAVQNFGQGAEEAIGNYLGNEADEIFRNAITNLIPVSDRMKKHARNSAPLTGEMTGVTSLYIHTKKPFHYLYFPDQGEGTSKRSPAHEFMEGGVDAQYDTVVNALIDALINELNKNL